jgi:hypothetical protein
MLRRRARCIRLAKNGGAAAFFNQLISEGKFFWIRFGETGATIGKDSLEASSIVQSDPPA